MTTILIEGDRPYEFRSVEVHEDKTATIVTADGQRFHLTHIRLGGRELTKDDLGKISQDRWNAIGRQFVEMLNKKPDDYLKSGCLTHISINQQQIQIKDYIHESHTYSHNPTDQERHQNEENTAANYALFESLVKQSLGQPATATTAPPPGGVPPPAAPLPATPAPPPVGTPPPPSTADAERLAELEKNFALAEAAAIFMQQKAELEKQILQAKSEVEHNRIAFEKVLSDVEGKHKLEIQHLKHQQELIQTDLQHTQGKGRELETNIAKRKAKADTLKQKLDEVQTRGAEKDVNLATLQQQHQQAEASLEALQRQKQQVDAEYQKLDRLLKEKDTALRAAESQFYQDKETLTQKFYTAELKYKDEITDLKLLLKDAELKLQLGTEKVQKSTEDKDAIIEQLKKKHEQEMTNLTKEHDDLKTKFETDINNAKQETADAKEKELKDQYQQQITKLQEQLQHKSELEQTQEKFQAINSQLAHLIKDLTAGKSKLGQQTTDKLTEDIRKAVGDYQAHIDKLVKQKRAEEKKQ